MCSLFETKEPSPGRPGFPSSLQTQRKVKSKQVKSTQAKGKPRFGFVFFFLLLLVSERTPLQSLYFKNKKNRQFQLLNIGRDEQPLFLEK